MTEFQRKKPGDLEEGGGQRGWWVMETPTASNAKGPGTFS